MNTLGLTRPRRNLGMEEDIFGIAIRDLSELLADFSKIGPRASNLSCAMGPSCRFRAQLRGPFIEERTMVAAVEACAPGKAEALAGSVAAGDTAAAIASARTPIDAAGRSPVASRSCMRLPFRDDR